MQCCFLQLWNFGAQFCDTWEKQIEWFCAQLFRFGQTNTVLSTCADLVRSTCLVGHLEARLTHWAHWASVPRWKLHIWHLQGFSPLCNWSSDPPPGHKSAPFLYPLPLSAAAAPFHSSWKVPPYPNQCAMSEKLSLYKFVCRESW